MSNTENMLSADHSLSEKWQERFAFFDQHGGPQAPGHKEALKALPFRKGLMIGMNFIAWFFGPIYLFVLGMWRKNLSLIAIISGIMIVSALIEVMFDITLPHALNMGINVAFSMMYAKITNYGYYLTQVKGSKSWNPFEGMRWA